MPRLYPHLSERLAAAYQGALDTLDAAAMLCLTFGVMAVESTLAFYDNSGLLWLAGLLLIVSVAFYRGALVAAAQHGALLEVAFDLHRFELLESLHLELPRDAKAERVTAQRLQEFWSAAGVEHAQLVWSLTRYSHAKEKTEKPSTIRIARSRRQRSP
jgi:hypothetical protein